MARRVNKADKWTGEFDVGREGEGKGQEYKLEGLKGWGRQVGNAPLDSDCKGRQTDDHTMGK